MTCRDPGVDVGSIEHLQRKSYLDNCETSAKTIAKHVLFVRYVER